MDNPGVFSLQLDSTQITANEGNPTIEVTIVRSQGSEGTVTVDYRSVESSALADLDYSPVSGTATFSEGETSQIISIPILEDNLAEEIEIFSLTIDNATGGASLAAPRTAFISIEDNDLLPGMDIDETNTGTTTEEESLGAEPIRQEVVTGLTMPTAIDWTPGGGTIFIAEKAGVIKAFSNGQLQETPVIDLSDQVNDFQDRGLTDIAVHPDFFNGSPYIYAAYTYDPPEVFDNTGLAGPDGSGNRAARLGRFTINLEDLENLTVVPGSEEVIVGRNSTWENFNGFVDSTIDFDEPPAQGIVNKIPDFLADDAVSHSVGTVKFGPDGALYLSNGDGASFNVADPRAARVQDLDTLSGKILRIDPITGAGLADNPFYDGDPNSNRSKIYQYGFRNPFRFTIDPLTGTVYTGDVGWFTWEEINVGAPGANFGWPFYEGGNGANERTPDYQNLPEAQAFYGSERDNVTPAILGLNHSADNVNSIIMGDIYRGSVYPAEYQGDLFFNDLAQGIVRNISFDQVGNITDVNEFVRDTNFAVQIVQGPDDNLYFVELFSGIVGRWEFETAEVP